MKRVVFVTNYVIFHQTSLWDEVNKSPEIDFCYLSTAKLDQERKKMKYAELDRQYVLKSYDCSNGSLKQIFSDAEIVFFGCTEDKRVYRYLHLAKKVVYISEHISKTKKFKEKVDNLKYKIFLKLFVGRKSYALLCNSSFVKNDLSSILKNKNNIFKFGYFPFNEIGKEPVYSIKNKYNIVWCGRFLDWKRPELAIKALKFLKECDDKYVLTMIGEGGELSSIKELVSKLGLLDSVTFLPFIENQKVLEIFNKSSLFIFSSNNQEGWGVVLNESMSQGCIALASTEAGATRYLIKDAVNGFTFDDEATFFNKLKKYHSLQKEDIITIQRNSYLTVSNLWNYKNAALWLKKFIETEDEFVPPLEGPMSKDNL